MVLVRRGSGGEKRGTREKKDKDADKGKERRNGRGKEGRKEKYESRKEEVTEKLLNEK